MIKDFKLFLWALKLGALINLYFLGQTFISPLVSADANLIRPAQILFIVSAFRCLFPVRYKDNIVFHQSPFSSIFLTRLIATFSEIALIYQLAYLLRLLNLNQAEWINWLSWAMVLQVIVSQIFVWGSILTGQLKLFFYEELGWAFIYSVNTIATGFLYFTIDNFNGKELLLIFNLLFGAVYLPWQFIHLRALQADAVQKQPEGGRQTAVIPQALKQGLHRALTLKNPTSDAQAWGGWIGFIWMTSYWATLIPMWAYQIALIGGT